MSKTDKLLKKLENGSISVDEVRTLLKKLGWTHLRTRGSHETWSLGGKVIIIASHTKELPRYQIRDIQEKLGVLK